MRERCYNGINATDVADFLGVFMEKLNAFLEKSYTAFHAVENAKALLDEQGFTALCETEDWALE